MRFIVQIVFILLSVMASLNLYCHEIRAVWATSWEIDTPGKIDKLVEDMVSNNQNTILAEIRYRADALYIPNKSNCEYTNPDPRSYILDNLTFDALQYLIDSVSGKDISLHAWLPAYVAAPVDLSRLPQSHIYFTHPELFTCKQKKDSDNCINDEGYFLDPGNPEVLEYLKNVIMDIVSNYPQIDGVHLDYFRYPGIDFGYNEEAYKGWLDYNERKPSSSFSEWKRLQLNKSLKEIHNQLSIVDSNKVLSVAVVSDYQRAITDYSQDWLYWLENDYIDYVYPMVYSTNTIIVSSFLSNKNYLEYKDKVVIGLRAFNSYPKQDYPLFKIKQNINEVRTNGYVGISLFSYSELLQKYFTDLKESYYQQGAIQPIIQPHSKDEATTQEVETILKTKELTQIDSTEVVCEDFTIKLQQKNNKFVVIIETDTSCHIEWKIKSKNGFTLFNRFRWYSKGKTIEKWDGQLDNSDYLQSGDYILTAFSELHHKSVIKRIRVK